MMMVRLLSGWRLPPPHPEGGLTDHNDGTDVGVAHVFTDNMDNLWPQNWQII